MKNIYLPVENVNDFACYSVYNNDTIRAYYTMPQVNSSSNYKDFYINSHYLEKEGTQNFNSYNQYLPSCISKENITNNYYYRNDFASSLFIFTIFAIFGILIPIKIFVRLFRRFDF